MRCARVVTAEQKAALDLRCLELIYSGSEPIDPRALDRFAEAFASCGLKREALYACYGMAESTLLSTGGTAGAGVRYFDVDADTLAAHRPAPATEKFSKSASMRNGKPPTSTFDQSTVMPGAASCPFIAASVASKACTAYHQCTITATAMVMNVVIGA